MVTEAAETHGGHGVSLSSCVSTAPVTVHLSATIAQGARLKLRTFYPMKLSSCLLPGLLLIPASVWGGTNASAIAVAVESPRQAPAASIVQRADFLCAVVVVRNSNREIEKQTAAVQQSVAALRKAAERSNSYHLHDGPVFSTGDLPQPGVTGGVLQATLRILCPLSNTSSAEMIGAMKGLRQFIASVDVAGGAPLEVSSISLAIESPEQYRDRLLELISEQTRVAQRALDARTVGVEGLGNSVALRQLDEVYVEIYIEHQISATLGR